MKVAVTKFINADGKLMFCIMRCIEKVYTQDEKILFDNSMEYYAKKSIFPEKSITVYRHEIMVHRTGITIMLNEDKSEVDDIDKIEIEEFDINRKS